MRHWLLVTLLIPALVGCSLIPVVKVTVTQTASATGSPLPVSSSPSASASATATPTPSSSPQPLGVLLRGNGVGAFGFGAPRAAVEADLTQRLGKPQRVLEDAGCPFNPLWTRTLVWKGLSVQFEAADKFKTSKTTLTRWNIRLDQGVPAHVTLAHGLGFTWTFAQVKAKYPTSAMTTEIGWHILRTPVGVTYLGETAKTPTSVMGGPLAFCE